MVHVTVFTLMMEMMMTQPGSGRACDGSGRLGHPAGR